MPQHSSSYHRARSAAAIVDRSDRAWVVVSGADRRSYLHGLLTNDILALEAGQGCYAAYLTPQGRMIADLWVYELGDVLLLSMTRDVKPAVLAKLNQFIFTEDVQLGDVRHVRRDGNRRTSPASSRMRSAPVDRRRGCGHGNVRTDVQGQPAIVLRTTDTGNQA
jgi:folate-binding Fe-S cluster repair protein YgfZ